jgi:hypothetical protein
MFAWAWLSSQERHVRAYVELYAALGWACLVCHSDFLTLYVRLCPPCFTDGDEPDYTAAMFTSFFPVR